MVFLKNPSRAINYEKLIALFRFPDFLMQLQQYEGMPKTLCEIVGPKTITNSTAEMYTYI